jgi:hypothetical protein
VERTSPPRVRSRNRSEGRRSTSVPRNAAISTLHRLLVSFAAVPLLAAPTFHKDVLPILQNRCQECHRAGALAPMSFTTYPETRPWAKSIRDAVVTHRMPPWFADTRFGHFANDRSLTKQEIDKLVAWADAGAPAGDPREAPPARVWPQGWNIEKPDAVFEMPSAFPIPARGAIEYQYIILPTRFGQDQWVQQVEVRPGVRSAVHHAVVYIREPGSEWLKDQPVGKAFSLPMEKGVTTSDILMVYSPGNSFDTWKPGMAKRLKAGSELVLQLHYTTNGKAALDRTRIGVVFAKQPPGQAVLTLQMGNDKFAIPPGDANFPVRASGTMPNDALLISMFPHMHLRGKSIEYSIVAPGGAVEPLLKIDHYDFYWQLNYKLAEPRPLRAGTRLVVQAAFDNSRNNPLNPDPSAEVRFGGQSWEEMMIGFFDVAVDAGLDKPAFFQRSR